MSRLFAPLEPVKAYKSYPLFKEDSLCDVSFVIPARKAHEFLKVTVEEVMKFFKKELPKLRFEIILVPNPSLRAVLDPEPDHSVEVSKELEALYPEQVRVVPHFQPEGKGAALRSGFLECRGHYIFFTDADLPYDLSFFKSAFESLKNGSSLVTANRRLSQSEFDIPMPLLPLAYKRHRLGLLFNRCVRLLFPSIESTDTQAGMKALTRELAQSFVLQQLCPGFFFDVELFLILKAQKKNHQEFPILLFLKNEKSTVRIFREAILAAFWLGRLWWAQLRGHYRTLLFHQP